MPFKSRAQEQWGHSPAGIKALGGPAKVAEWDAATAGKKLPERLTIKQAAGIVAKRRRTKRKV